MGKSDGSPLLQKSQDVTQIGPAKSNNGPNRVFDRLITFSITVRQAPGFPERLMAITEGQASLRESLQRRSNSFRADLGKIRKTETRGFVEMGSSTAETDEGSVTVSPAGRNDAVVVERLAVRRGGARWSRQETTVGKVDLRWHTEREIFDHSGREETKTSRNSEVRNDDRVGDSGAN